jgi:triosephosphate isomerase
MASEARPRRLVGTSLKMYFSIPKTLEYIRSLSAMADDGASLPPAGSGPELFVIPDYLTILEARKILHGVDTAATSPIASPPHTTGAAQKASTNRIELGAQDAFWSPAGAFTGEVSPRSLAEAGVRYVELGHAERRRLFHETDAEVGQKVKAAVDEGLVPLVCIGEVNKPTTGDAQAGARAAADECAPQVQAVLGNIPDEAEVVLAYEPVWAIGASEPAGAEHVVAVAKMLRESVRGRKGLVRILYGGSAGPGTFDKLKDGVDGLFLGRFAHDVENFKKVIWEMTV